MEPLSYSDAGHWRTSGLSDQCGTYKKLVMHIEMTDSYCIQRGECCSEADIFNWFSLTSQTKA